MLVHEDVVTANKGTGEGRVELSMLVVKTTPVGDGAFQRSSADLKKLRPGRKSSAVRRRSAFELSKY